MGSAKIPYLFRLLGGKALVSFALTSLIILFILVAVNVTSQHGLKQYGEEQVGKVPWDITIFQQDNLQAWRQLRERLNALEHLERVENLVLVSLPGIPELQIRLDGKRIFFPWLTILSVTDPALLPPELEQIKLDQGSAAVMTFGPGSLLEPFSAQIQSHIEVSMRVDGPDRSLGQEATILSTNVSAVTETDRTQFLEWLLSKTGSIAFFSSYALILYVPIEDIPDFLDRLFQVEYVYTTGHANSPIVPEVTHLLSADREALVSGWDIAGSAEKSRAVIDSVKRVADGVTPINYVNSDLNLTLDKLAAVSKTLRLAAVAIALPLIWVTWIFTSTLTRLVVLNRRRVIGLLRLRGVPGAAIRRGFTLIMAFSSLGGATAGLLLGIIVPLGIYRLTAGEEVPFRLIPKIQDPLSSLLYVGVAALLSWLMAKGVVSYVLKRTPVEAVARVSEHEARSFAPQISELQIVPLILGSYKLTAWLVGFRLESVTDRLPLLTGHLLVLADKTLDLIGPALFLYGVVAVLAAKFATVQRLLMPLARLVAGRLWTVLIRTLALKPHRVFEVVLTAALLLGVCLYPQVSLDTFNDHVFRAAEIVAGSSLALDFDASRLTEHSQPTLGEATAMGESLKAKIEESLEVEEVTPLISFMPTLSMAGPRGHTLYILEPLKYLEAVHYDEVLGVGKPFQQVINGLGNGVALSKGFADTLSLYEGEEILVGKSFSGENTGSQIGGVISYLPGMPSVAPDFREGYAAAEIDYLTHVFSTNPYMVTDFNNGLASSISGFVDQLTLLVKLKQEIDPLQARSTIVDALPLVPNRVRTVQAEVSAMGRDMFIHLSTSNMKLGMLAGLVISLASILVLFLVNYAESRRTFSLLRLRGASLVQIIRLSSSETITTALVGVMTGSVVGIISGYGLANHLRTIPLAMTTMSTLPARIIWSPMVFAIIVGSALLLVLLSIVLGAYVFRRTARETMEA